MTTRGRAVIACVLSAALFAHAELARADDELVLAEGTAAPEEVAQGRTIRQGRALTWGVTAIVPLLISDVREVGGRQLAYLNPGGGVEGRVGYELEHGLAIGVAGGVSAFVSENSRAVASYRAAIEGRWTIDLGAIVAPTIGVAAGLFLGQLDAGMVPTAYGRVQLGAQILLAPWIALEAGVSLEGALGWDAFADSIAWITPQVGLSFYE